MVIQKPEFQRLLVLVTLLASHPQVVAESRTLPSLSITRVDPKVEVELEFQLGVLHQRLDVSADLENWDPGEQVPNTWSFITHPDDSIEITSSPSTLQLELENGDPHFFRLRPVAPEVPTAEVISACMLTGRDMEIFLEVDSGIAHPLLDLTVSNIQGTVTKNSTNTLTQTGLTSAKLVAALPTVLFDEPNDPASDFGWTIKLTNQAGLETESNFFVGPGTGIPLDTSAYQSPTIAPSPPISVLSGCDDVLLNPLVGGSFGRSFTTVVWTGPAFLNEVLEGQGLDLSIPASATSVVGTHTLTLTLENFFGYSASGDFTLIIGPTEPLSLSPEGGTELTSFSMSPITLASTLSHTPCQTPDYRYDWQVLDEFGVDVGVAPPFGTQTTWDLESFDLPFFGETWEYTLTVSDPDNSEESDSVTWLVTAQ